MKDYLVFGTRYNKFDEVFKWISEHQNAGYDESNAKDHLKVNYGAKKDIDQKDINKHRYFMFNETSLVYHEDLMFAYKTANYTKTILIFRDLYDVIEDILSCTFKPEFVDSIISNQIDLFEEYADEYLDETNKLPHPYRLFLNYNRWMTDIGYRNEIATDLGFENTDFKTYSNNHNSKLRDKLRYRKHFTSRVKSLNHKVMTK